MFLPARLIVSYKNGAFSLSASVGFSGIRIPLIERKKRKTKSGRNAKTAKKTDDFTRFEKLFAVLQAFYESSAGIRKSITVEKLEIDSKYGSEDAAFTGMAIGFAYAEIYKLLAFLSAIFTLEQPIITITPVFEDRAVFLLTFEGIIKTKAAHIIFIANKFYSEYKKALKRKD